MGSCLQLDEKRSIAFNVGDVVRAARVLPGLPQVLGNLIAGAQCTAIRELLINRRDAGKEISGRAGLDLEDVDARGDVLVEEIRLGKAQIDLLRAKRNDRTDTNILTAAEEISFADIDVGERDVARRKTETER